MEKEHTDIGLTCPQKGKRGFFLSKILNVYRKTKTIWFGNKFGWETSGGATCHRTLEGKLPVREN